MAESLHFAPPALPFGVEPVATELDIRAEQTLLGALLMFTQRALPRVPPTFRADYFAEPVHRTIFEAIVEIGVGANPISVRAALALPPEDDNYLLQLVAAGAPSWMETEAYCHTVSEAFLRRDLKCVLNEGALVLQAGSHHAPASAIINQAMARMDAIAAGSHNYRSGSSFDTALDAAIKQAERAAKGEAPAGRSPGMASVDEALGGLEAGTFNVLGARPGMGKTAICCQWAINIARQCKDTGDGGVLAFSLEMSATALARRALAEASRVPVVDLKRGRGEGKIDSIGRAHHALRGLPFLIEDAGGQNLVAIRQKTRAAQRKFKRLALIMVDHINIVAPDEADRRQGATQAIGRISNALRDLSKEFDCPVLCLSQLNRGLLAREDKRPTLADLRQTGDIEQDADAVMFLHRPEVFLPKSAPERGPSETIQKLNERVQDWEDARAQTAGKAELIFEKVRDGAPCSVPLTFDHQTISFSEAAA